MSTTTQWSATTSMDVLLEVLNERSRQDEKWGQQDHPDLWEKDMATMAEVREFANNAAQNFKDAEYTDAEPIDWAAILSEEFFETLAESNPLKIRAELIQVAAVAVAWIEAIDRRDL